MAIESKEFIIGALIGSGIAAAAVLLFTPRSGSKVRAMVQDFVNGEMKHFTNSTKGTKFASNGKTPHSAHHKSVHKKTDSKDANHVKHTIKKTTKRKPVS